MPPVPEPSSRRILPLFTAIGLAVHATLACAKPIEAQFGGDSTATHHVDPVVITANRKTAPLSTSTSAVVRVDAHELAKQPARSVADVVLQTVGFTAVDFEGTGLDPQIIVRGFYGGGEADYLVVLVDGKPLNSLETGRITWDLIPVNTIESIEIVRGGMSAAWGDAALGGVVNIITKRGQQRIVHTALSAGSNGVRGASASIADTWRGHDFALAPSFTRSSGFRTNAKRAIGSLSGSATLFRDAARELTLSTLNDWRTIEDPGPLSTDRLAASRTQASPFYRFDQSKERFNRADVSGSIDGELGRVSGTLLGEYRHSDRIRTLPLAPNFADTKNRLLTTTRLASSLLIDAKHGFTQGLDQLLVGVDASTGRIRSVYYGFLQGASNTYLDTVPTRGDLLQRGVGSRNAVAGFYRYGIAIVPALQVSFAGRFDWLRDHFTPQSPSTDSVRSATHTAFSPKLGMNLRYLDAARYTGNLYANWGRSFKAPTPDQLYDQRTVPSPMPPYQVAFANGSLVPQLGTNTEAGIYQHAELIPDAVYIDLSTAAYQLDMRNELDFDMTTFRFENIGKSQHRGLESGLRITAPRSIALFSNYTIQSVISKDPTTNGKALKAIPRNIATSGVSMGSATGLLATLTVSSVRKVALDDMNTQYMPGWTRCDARFSTTVQRVRVTMDVFNLLNTRYNSSGFLDSADPSVTYYYPAAGRSIMLRISR